MPLDLLMTDPDKFIPWKNSESLPAPVEGLVDTPVLVFTLRKDIPLENLTKT